MAAFIVIPAFGPAFVRSLRQYYAAVRLPLAVRVGLIAHRLLPPVPPLSGCGWQQGLSVLAREVSVHAWGLRLRSACVALALYRASQCCLPVSLTPSAPLILAFSEFTISGYPAYTCPYPTLQVRGFPPPSHGLGSGWFATPFLYDSFIHYFTPVYPDAIQASEPAPQSESEEGGDGCELGLEGFLDFENRILQTKSRI